MFLSNGSKPVPGAPYRLWGAFSYNIATLLLPARDNFFHQGLPGQAEKTYNTPFLTESGCAPRQITQSL